MARLRAPRSLPHAAQVALRAIVDESGYISIEMIEGDADAMRAEAGMGLYPEPERFAAALNIGIWKESGAECGGVNVLGDVIVRPSADMRRECLSILHEIAHERFRRAEGVDYGHGDVWLLALALAVPRSELWRPGLDLRRESWVSGWAVDLRVAIGRR